MRPAEMLAKAMAETTQTAGVTWERVAPHRKAAWLCRADHLLAELTRAGYEVVTLPEPDRVEDEQSDDGLEDWTTTTWVTDFAYVSTFDPNPDGPQVYLRSFEGPTTPDHLRTLAGALLAAAHAAEVDQ